MVGILAQVTGPSGEPLMLAYEPTEVSRPSLSTSSVMPSWGIYLFIILGLIIMILLATLGFYLRRKSIRLKRKLEYNVYHANVGSEISSEMINITN
jgi:hypothetical protein